MLPLEKSLRNQLERTVTKARDEAEDAARAALGGLGVGEAAPFPHLTEDDRKLRRKLRAHGRQLGDSLNGGKVQTMDRLIEEVAYEHWHRMLFARFLAENDLLMYWPDGDDDPISIDLATCQELIDEGTEQAASQWELAARFAARMLPQIFRPDSPVLQLHLAPEHQKALEDLVASLPKDVFIASDSLGWVYQFWQAKKKDEVNKSGSKIGARELPSVTQLFTEPYMVSFLLDNALGAWWAARRLTEDDLKNAASEDELRQKASIPGVPLEYLRFVKQDDGAWTPAAGTFDAWPQHLSELKTLDPCNGSGHFLVALFLMLVPMRMELEGLSAQDAVDRVLQENIHGLEIDQRCVEIAAFALALTAWSYPHAGGYRPLPQLNVACSGLSVSVSKDQWLRLAGDDHNLRIALGQLYEVFQDAPVLGSLLNPSKTDAARLVDWEKLSAAMDEALRREEEDEQIEASVAAQGLARAAALLSDKYSWVVTNVPYLARGKQDASLAQFCERNYPLAKADLATVFLEACLEICHPGGTASIVLPQNWLFLTTYRKFREKLLTLDTWHLIARLGEGGFDSSAAAGAFTVLISISRGSGERKGVFTQSEDDNQIRGLDVSSPRTAAEKADRLMSDEIKTVGQAKQLDIPDARITLAEVSVSVLLANHADALVGLQTSDDPLFTAAFWEMESRDSDIWELMQSTPEAYVEYAGQSWLVRWEQGKGMLHNLTSAYPSKGQKALGKKGIAIHRMRKLFPYHYGKVRFHQNVAVVIPKEEVHLPAIWCYCASSEFNTAVRQIDQSLKVTNASLVKVPFDLAYWSTVAEVEYPNGLPKPYSDDPTQWIFHGHPTGSVIWNEETKWTSHGNFRTDDIVLQVAVARLLGYRWPAELDPEMELSDEAREWVKKCDELLPLADTDGIVCIPPVRGEAPASDRLFKLLVAAYGDEWSNEVLAKLLAESDHVGKDLESWLRDKFFTQHCKLFHHRPFIWHIWDGLPDGFAALINYHKLDYKNLETLIYTYLGDWISRQKQDIANGVDGAQEKLAAALALKKSLELILQGEEPYDIFVRWKPLSEQPIGWNPDLNDGVRMNIRPFMTVPDVKKKGAGVLRDKPNIKWDKDRGKDVESAPWYNIFKGDRINDHHLSLAEKQAARSKQ